MSRWLTALTLAGGLTMWPTVAWAGPGDGSGQGTGGSQADVLIASAILTTAGSAGAAGALCSWQLVEGGIAGSSGVATWPFVRDAGAFCVNVLAHGQDDLCWRFAKPGDDKFNGVTWRPAETGSPILDGVLAWIDCRIEEIVDAGDHWFVLGRIMDMDCRDGDPLLFFRGKIGTFHQD